MPVGQDFDNLLLFLGVMLWEAADLTQLYNIHVPFKLFRSETTWAHSEPMDFY